MAETRAQAETRIEAELVLVRVAIAKALGAQSYSVRDRQVNRPNLRTLRDLEKELESKLRALTSGGIRVLKAVPV